MNQNEAFSQDEIIEMAYKKELEAFAKLVAETAASKEREACAKVCDDIDDECDGENVRATWCSQAIRARGETTSRGEA